MWLRMNVLLLGVLVVSSVAQVRQSYEHRRSFAALERAKFEARKLEADLAHLQAERENEATNLRVEQLARERLLMRPITPAVTLATAPNPASPAASQP